MDVSIERDGTQVQDAGRGAHHVERHPGVAELGPEHPIAEQIVHSGESHHQRGHEQIGDR